MNYIDGKKLEIEMRLMSSIRKQVIKQYPTLSDVSITLMSNELYKTIKEQ